MGRSLGKRVGKLEDRVDALSARVEEGFAKVEQRFESGNKAIMEIREKMVTKDDLKQMFGNR